MAEQLSGADEARKTRVFISYSRKDKAFTDRLAGELIGRGYKVDYDTSSFDPANIDTGISAEDDWWKRLQEMIAACEAMVFIASPDSAASRVCDEEIACARTLGKRVIPILLRSIDFTKAPPRLAALNVKLSFEHETTFEASLAALTNALDVDVAWHREGARLTALATRWDQDGRADMHLLSPGGVEAAEAWAARRPGGAPEPGDLVRLYIEAGREKARSARDHLLATVGRAYVQPAAQALAEGRVDAALRIAAAGVVLSQDVALQRVPELGEHIAAALGQQTLFAALEEHPLPLACGAFSRDGGRVAVAMRIPEEEDLRDWDPPPSEEDRRSFYAVRIFDIAGRSPPVSLQGQSDQIERIGFSPDAKQIATQSSDGQVNIWDAASGAKLASAKTFPEGFGRDSRRSADGARVLEVSEGREGNAVHICDAASGRVMLALAHGEEPIADAHFSPDGTRVLSICEGGTRCWDAYSGAELESPIRRKENYGGCCAFSEDGSRVLDEDGRIWNAETDRRIATFEHEADVAYATLSPDGTRVASACGHGVKVWDAAQAALVAAFQTPAPVRCVSFSPDGARILAACGDGAARVFDLAGRREPLVLAGAQSAKEGAPGVDRLGARFQAHAAFDADGRRIVTVDGATARIWDAVSGKLIKALVPDASVAEESRPGWASFSPDGAKIVVASSVFDNPSGRRDELARADEYWSKKPLFDQNGRPIAAPPDHRRYTARIWDVASAREIMILRGLEGEVRTAAFSPDGTEIVAAGGRWSAGAMIFDVASGRRRVSIHDASSAFFSFDGGRVVTAGKRLSVCDAGNGDTLMELATLEGMARFASAEFSADGMRVVAAAGRAVSLYDVSRTVALTGDVVEVLAASLTNGRGRRGGEGVDLLMRQAPDDLYEGLMALLSPQQRERVALRAVVLAQPLHANCYLAPSRRPRSEPRKSTADDVKSEPRPAARPAGGARDSSASWAKPAPRKAAGASRRGPAAWIALAILALAAAAAFALVRLDMISLGQGL